MKPLIIALLAGILVVSCSEERSSDSGTDSRIAIAQCLNEKLAGITSEHTELRSVFLHEGRVVSYIFHVFTGQFYTIDSGTLLPKKNMVIAAKFSEGYFDALKAASPKRREDYEPLRERFGEADARRISDIVRHGDLYFLGPEVAAVSRDLNSITPKQPYLLRDGRWIYQMISDGPPNDILRSETSDVLHGIDRFSSKCEKS
mgnify:CR=1 FL=1|jgi:hypothetical protein|tara:strand:+ start:14661 stop:15266 length:606 start_codon:yes stop_codon:yes gene_type:complete